SFFAARFKLEIRWFFNSITQIKSPTLLEHLLGPSPDSECLLLTMIHGGWCGLLELDAPVERLLPIATRQLCVASKECTFVNNLQRSVGSNLWHDVLAQSLDDLIRRPVAGHRLEQHAIALQTLHQHVILWNLRILAIELVRDIQ